MRARRPPQSPLAAGRSTVRALLACCLLAASAPLLAADVNAATSAEGARRFHLLGEPAPRRAPLVDELLDRFFGLLGVVSPEADAMGSWPQDPFAPQFVALLVDEEGRVDRRLEHIWQVLEDGESGAAPEASRSRVPELPDPPVFEASVAGPALFGDAVSGEPAPMFRVASEATPVPLPASVLLLLSAFLAPLALVAGRGLLRVPARR